MITSVDDSEDPSFCEVSDIFVINGHAIWLGLLQLDVVEFSSHYNSWIVKKSKRKLLKLFNDLPTRQILPLRPARNPTDYAYFITLKYAP